MFYDESYKFQIHFKKVVKFLNDLHENKSKEAKRLLQSDKQTFLCIDCKPSFSDSLRTLYESHNWEVVILIYYDYILQLLGDRYNWLPYHKVFLMDFQFHSYGEGIKPKVLKDIPDVLAHPNYNRFTHFAQMYETKKNCSNRIIMTLPPSIFIENFKCVIKLSFAVISRFRMNQKIIVNVSVEQLVGYNSFIKFYKLTEKVTIIAENQLEMTDDDIKITYIDYNDQFVIEGIEGRSIPQDTFYCYEDQIDIVEKLMHYCRRS